MMQGHRVDFSAHTTEDERSRQCRGEVKRVAHTGMVQRLDAQAVAGQKDLAAVAVHDSESEHAVEMPDSIRSPGMIGFENDLRIPVGEKTVSFGFQALTQFVIVVNRTVVDDGVA